MLKQAIVGALLTYSVASFAQQASNEAEDPRAPGLSQEQVDTLFGTRLANGNREENLLLLAIAMDHQSKESPTRDEQIGIPFVAQAGPGYWALLLDQEKADPSLSTLVNNALILSFINETGYPDDVRQAASTKLLSLAADKQYWPAMVYLAEKAMRRWESESTVEIPFKQEGPVAIYPTEQEQVFGYLMSCAKIGFAPCQIRLGFWYLQSPNQQEAAIGLLRAGVEIARRDNRYLDSIETVNDTKAALTVLLNLRLTPEEQADYQNLLGELEQLSKEAS